MSSSSSSSTPANFNQQVINLKTLGGNSERFLLESRASGRLGKLKEAAALWWGVIAECATRSEQ
jgi:hypothetical protein